MRAALKAYHAAWSLLKAGVIAEDGDEAIAAAAVAEREAARALAEAPCSGDEEFFVKIEAILACCLYDEGALPKIGESFGPLLLAVAAYLEQRHAP